MPIRCLIVDDSRMFLDAARPLLENAGISVVSAVSTGEDALRAVEELHPDVALVDVQLLGESGIELARRLAALERTPRVILISLQSEDDLQELIAAAPVDGFIPKNRLSAAAIHELLGRGE
jgi:DNA-binding NarL/FixJ family response regulator